MNIEFIRHLIGQQEDETLEFKRDFSKSGNTILTKHIAAMANTLGGTIIVGVDERKGLIGTNYHVTKQELEEGLNPVPDFTVLDIDLDGRRLVVIQVKKSNMPVLCNGAWYVKKDSSVRLADSSDIYAQNNSDYVGILYDMNKSIQNMEITIEGYKSTIQDMKKQMEEIDQSGQRSTIKWSIISMITGAFITALFTYI